MTDPTLDPKLSRRTRATPPTEDADDRPIDPRTLARWLDSHADRLAERWLEGVLHRLGEVDGGPRELLAEFHRVLVDFLPAYLGPYRDQVQPIWDQAAELYGSVGAMRGLAAGEVIEEFQILREEVIRLFYDVPPVRDLDRLALREVLHMNRVLDLGVTHASVGHTDALFFALFRGTGVPESLSDEQVIEVREQLRAIRSEFRGVMRLLED